jgi:hypothetical protein
LREAAQAVLHAVEHGHPNGTQGMYATLDALHEALREHALVRLSEDALNEMQALTESEYREHALVRLSEMHKELDDALTERMTFNHWWNEGEVSPGDNPYTHETAAYWAWEGWQAGAKAERETCAKVVENYCGAWDHQGFALAQAIRARAKE